MERGVDGWIDGCMDEKKKLAREGGRERGEEGRGKFLLTLRVRSPHLIAAPRGGT